MHDSKKCDKIFIVEQSLKQDVNSLVWLSDVFKTSIDNLIKGDIEIMKKQIQSEDQMKFGKMSKVFSGLLIATIITPVPLAHYGGIVGIIVWIVLTAVTFYFAILVEKQKKAFDIQTYREIVAFTQGTGLDSITKAREEGKRLYQKILLAVGTGAITLLIAMAFSMLFK